MASEEPERSILFLFRVLRRLICLRTSAGIVLTNQPVRVLPTLIALGFHWPTLWTFIFSQGLLCFCRQRSVPLCDLQNDVLIMLQFDLMVRCWRLLTMLLHELSHVAAAAFVASCRVSSPCHAPVLEGLCSTLARSKLDVFRWNLLVQLIPFAYAEGLHVELELPFVLEEPSSRSLIHLAGLVFSLCLPVLFLPATLGQDPGTWALFFGSLATACGALLSDLPSGPLLGWAAPPGIFCCGNWGCLVPRDALGGDSKKSAFPDVIAKLLSQLLEIVELRGAQAGGCSIFLSEDGRNSTLAVRSRVVKSKRGHVGPMIFSKLRKELRGQNLGRMLSCRRWLRPLPTVLAQGHTRFGTSSAPRVRETHPHQWLGSHYGDVWQRDQFTGLWTCEKKINICVTVTHNGDFNGWKVYDDIVPTSLLGAWLSKVLHHRNEAECDSAKIAGMMDLLVTQGDWHACLRLAFITHILQHVDEACGWEDLHSSSCNMMPSPAVFAAWGEVFSKVFRDMLEVDPCQEPSTKFIERLATSSSICLGVGLPAIASKPLTEFNMRGSRLMKFCFAACEYFFESDLLSAAWKFFAKAQGTFGVSFTCSRWPDTVVLAAKGQPMSLAFDSSRPLAFWSSEPASLSTFWPDSLRQLAGTARLDLDDAIGEAFEVRVAEKSTAANHIESLDDNRLSGTRLKFVPYLPLPGTNVDEEQPYHILLRGVSLDSDRKPRVVLKSSLRSRWVKLVMSPADASSRCLPFQSLPKAIGRDPIEKDLFDMPRALDNIEKAWHDKTSLNRATAFRFQRCLAYLVKQRAKESSNGIDVLIYGVENSLWLGQQFAADLARVFPRLKVVSMSSNWVLGMLQKDHGHVAPLNWTLSSKTFELSRHAITLAISQSGTTYPTVWATRLLRSQPVPGLINMFALSGTFDTVLANSIGDDARSCNFAANRFSTHSGIRPAEPSTLASMCMHHTLTKLLFYCVETLLRTGSLPERGRLPPGSPQPCDLQLHEIRELQGMASSLVISAEVLCGATRLGYQQASKERSMILEAGWYLASHLVENYYAALMVAIYILLTVTLGHPLLSGTLSLVKACLGVDSEDSAPLMVAGYVVAHADAWVYVFLAGIVITVHRKFSGRRLWTRYCSRQVVIVDSTVNYKLLRAYVSKLRSLAYRVSTFGVSGQNGADHFVHEIMSSTGSDVILAVGRPDGRLAGLSATEASVVMSTQQTEFIASRRSSGVEAISLGHNPWPGKAGLFKRALVLPTEQRVHFLSQRLLGTYSGAHDPNDVTHKVSVLTHQDDGLGEGMRRDYPWIEKDELLQRMGGKSHVSVTQARGIIYNLLSEQAEKLQIQESGIDINAVFEEPKPERQSSKLGRGRTSIFGGLSSRRNSSKTKSRFPSSVGFFLGQSSGQEMDDAGSPLSPGETDSSNVPLSTLMAALRGHKMREHVQRLQEAERESRMRLAGEDTREEKLKLMQLKHAGTAVQDAFTIWLEYVKSAVREPRSPTSPQPRSPKVKVQRSRSRRWNDDVDAAAMIPMEWRLHEIQRMALSSHLCFLGLSPKSVFKGWAIYSRTQNALRGKPRPPWCNPGHEVGAGLVGHAEGSELLAQLRLLEELYETRIGAAERLMGFFVLFHGAVRPLSKLLGFSFDMDRTESRLRVASTPSPIAFVERLPESPPTIHAISRIQRFFVKCQTKRHVQLLLPKLWTPPPPPDCLKPQSPEIFDVQLPIEKHKLMDTDDCHDEDDIETEGESSSRDTEIDRCLPGMLPAVRLVRGKVAVSRIETHIKDP